MIFFAIALATSAAPPPAALPRFEFRLFHAGDPMPKRGLFGCPTTSQPGEHICMENDFEVAGVWARKAATFYNSAGLTTLMFSVAIQDGPILKRSLLAKYGTPCATDISTVQNGYGAKFERETLQWCFADGKARFRSVGSKMGEASFIFTSESDQPSKPIVDF